MAVRLFDLTEPAVDTTGRLSKSLRDVNMLRRTKQRYAVVGIVSLAIPFFAALIVLRECPTE